MQVHGAELNDVLMTELRDLFFAMGRIAADNVLVPERTNDEAIADLQVWSSSHLILVVCLCVCARARL